MTNRERILNTLLGQTTDRAPFGVGLGFAPWGHTLERWRSESGIADLNPADYFGYDRGFVGVPAEYGPLPHFERKVVHEDAEFITTTDFRGLTVRNLRDHSSMPEFLDYPVKTADDWRRYRSERLQPRIEERLARLDGFIAGLVATDAPVQVGGFPWGMFGTPRDLLGAEELLVGFYSQPEVVRDMMETYTDLWLRLYSAIAARVRIDHIHIWEDMSGRNGSLISMQMVEEFMMPCYDRVASFAREREVPLLSVDSDGQVNELVAAMTAHGVNVFLPFEVQAGNDVREYRRQYPSLGIIGGMDKNALADDAPPGALRREIDRAADMLAAGRYIPGFDHLIPPNVSWATWKGCMETLKRLIGA